MKLKCWRSPKIKRLNREDRGISCFAIFPIKKNEILAIKTGHIVDENYIKQHTDIVKGSHMQITKDLFYAPTNLEEWHDTLIGFNHSCEPTAYIEGHVVLRALRSIKPDEEITTDYAITYTSDTQEFDCSCKAKNCRKHIKPSEDWKKPEIQTKYRGYFADFIQERIDKQNEAL